MLDPPLKCMNCGAITLAVRKREGFEMAMVLLTGKRKYVCLNCKHAFREVDRRRFPRESPEQP
jgi:DNA-directed RNA polymerase subunit RPC12/RpoP